MRGLERVGIGIKVGDDLRVTDYYGLHARVEVVEDRGYHGIRELMRELISVNLNASYRVLWSDGDSELDRLFVPYRQSNIIQLVSIQPPSHSPSPIKSRTISRLPAGVGLLYQVFGSKDPKMS